MANYKLVYIDEQISDADELKDFVEAKDTENSFEVEHLYPEKTLRDMLLKIIEASPNALISDFQLNEHIHEVGHPVPYNGMELVNAFLEIRENFPCFVITSFANEAATNSKDVNIVYIKGVLKDVSNTKDINFLDRVKIQIDHYRRRIESAEHRLQALLELSKTNTLDITQESELINLDSFLEASVDARANHKVPSELKHISNTQKLSELLGKVDCLIEKINGNE